MITSPSWRWEVDARFYAIAVNFLLLNIYCRLQRVLAPAESDGEEPEGCEEYTSIYESAEPGDSVKLYRDLLEAAGIADKNKAKNPTADCALQDGDDEEREEDLFSDDGNDKNGEQENKKDENDGLTPFEKYLVKRKNKQKERVKAKKEAAGVGKKREKDDDWDIPDDVKSDPFFKEELGLRRKEKLRLATEKRREKDEAMAADETEKQQREVRYTLTVNFILQLMYLQFRSFRAYATRLSIGW